MKDSKSPFHDDIILLRGLLYVFTTKKSFKVLLDCSTNKGEKCDVALQW